MAIKNEEEKLFGEWRAAKGQESPFVPDGVVDEEAYLASHPRLMFVLKEVNDPDYPVEWDLRKFLLDGACAATWDKIARSVAALRTPPRESHPIPDVIDEAFRKSNLKSIVAMNLKTIPGSSKAHWGTLQKEVQADGPFIRRQALLYKPDFVVCCGDGTASLFLGAVVDEPHLGRMLSENDNAGYAEWGESKVIRALHPQARIGKAAFAEDVVGTIRRFAS